MPLAFNGPATIDALVQTGIEKAFTVQIGSLLIPWYCGDSDGVSLDTETDGPRFRSSWQLRGTAWQATAPSQVFLRFSAYNLLVDFDEEGLRYHFQADSVQLRESAHHWAGLGSSRVAHSVAPLDSETGTASMVIERAMTISLLYPILLTAVAPLMRLYSGLRRRRRRRLRLCVTCGYDLRASGHRCPECGKSVPPGHTADIAS